MKTPKAAGFYQPAEWEAHESVWLAWPSHAELWEDNLPAAQAEFRALCEAIADLDPATGEPRGERLDILVPTAEARQAAEAALAHLRPRFHDIPFGDIWLRDTAPVFLKGADGSRAGARFVFNGWGGKYELPFDREVSAAVLRATGLPGFAFDWVLEGGSVETDGQGTLLTSEQCLLNENRNPGLAREDLERRLNDAFGTERVLWVGDGLINDHTDGHIDTIARFAAPGIVLCMQAQTSKDPNREIMLAIARDLEAMTDARGRKLEVVRVPSPGLVLDDEGEVMPASYLNFYIANTTVVVPVYGSAADQEAVAAIAACFPGRKTVGLPAKAILSGGGAFHCISQQVPL